METSIFRRTWNEKLLKVIFLLPALFLVTLFIIVPFISTIVLSVTNGPGFKIKEFVGLKQYSTVFHDRNFLSMGASAPQGALVNSLLWLVLGVPIAMFIGFVISLYTNAARSQGAFRSIFFLPMVISGTVIGIVWSFVYSPSQSIGLLNALFGTNISWLGDGKIVNFSLIATWIWSQVGMGVVIISAALKGVPTDLIDASKIDGTNNLQRLGYVVLPQIQPQLSFLLVTLMTSVLKVFDIVYVMTNGGPAGKSSTLALLFYNQTFLYSKPHYGAAIVTLMSILTILIFGFTRSKTQGDV